MECFICAQVQKAWFLPKLKWAKISPPLHVSDVNENKLQIIDSSFNPQTNTQNNQINPYFNNTKNSFSQNYYSHEIIINTTKISNQFDSLNRYKIKIGLIKCHVLDVAGEKNVLNFILTNSKNFEAKYINFLYDFIETLDNLKGKTKITLGVCFVFFGILFGLLLKRDRNEKTLFEDEKELLLQPEVEGDKLQEPDAEFDSGDEWWDFSKFWVFTFV